MDKCSEGTFRTMVVPETGRNLTTELIYARKEGNGPAFEERLSGLYQGRYYDPRVVKEWVAQKGWSLMDATDWKAWKRKIDDESAMHARRILEIRNGQAALDRLRRANVAEVRRELSQLSDQYERGMLAHSKEELVAAAFDVTGLRVSGIYFLIEGDEIVYVGQSVNMLARLGTHMTEAKKKFSKVAFIPVDVRYLNVAEGLYIHLFRPRENGAYEGGRPRGAFDPAAFVKQMSAMMASIERVA